MSTTKSRKSTAKPAVQADPLEALPETVRTAMSLVPTPQNKRDAEGRHLNPRMGRLLRAFRAANGNVAQTKVAGNPSTNAAFVTAEDGTPLFTTHCQIATLEQGGCKKGADESTIKLLAVALGVDEGVIRSINEQDLQERAEAGDERAKKVLGVADETGETPDSDAVQAIVEETTPADVPAVSAEGETVPAEEVSL